MSARHYPSLYKIFLLLLTCSGMQTAIAQGDLTKIPGHVMDYNRKIGPPNFLNNASLPTAVSQPMKAELLKLTEIVMAAEGFGQPKGYDLHVQLSVYPPSPYYRPLQTSYAGSSWMAIHDFVRNGKGEVEANVESSAGITIYVNDLLRLFPDDGSGEMDEYKVPRFVRSSLFSTRTDDQGNIHLSNGTVVITNGKPLFIPYTREQYLTYLIKQKEKFLKMGIDARDKNAKSEASAAVAPDGHKVTEADKNNENYSYLWAIKVEAEKEKPEYEKGVKDAEDALHAVQMQLQSMSAEEKKKQAYVCFSDPLKQLQLTSPDKDACAEALITPNPAYYNAALPKNAIQLITVRPDVSSFTQQYFVDYVRRVMGGINYSSLKAQIEKN